MHPFPRPQRTLLWIQLSLPLPVPQTPMFFAAGASSATSNVSSDGVSRPRRSKKPSGKGVANATHASISAAASASVVDVPSGSKTTKKAMVTIAVDTGTPANNSDQTTTMQLMLDLAYYLSSHSNSDLDDTDHANAIINVSLCM